jgi:phospholipase C
MRVGQADVSGDCQSRVRIELALRLWERRVASFRVVKRFLVAVSLVVVLVIAAGSLAVAAVATPVASAPAACGQSARRAPVIHRVIVVVMENHSYSDIIGHAPFITSLAHRCGLANNYHAVGHPSLPNYLAMTSGSTHGTTSDCTPSECPMPGPSIFSQVTNHHLRWRSYAESMPGSCDTGSNGLYAARHVPAVYYLRVRPTCHTHVRASGALTTGRLHHALNSGHAPSYMFVTPNLCNDMHDCSVSTGDTWLSRWIPMMTKSRAYRNGHTAILLVWDEGGGDNQVPLIVVSPYTRAGTVSTRAMNHYSLLRASEHLLGFRRYLGAANVFSGLATAFNL